MTTLASPAARMSWWRETLAGPVLAIQFLTAVPLPLAVPATPRHLGRALAFFPLAGALLGLALAGLDSVLLRALPASAATAVLLAAGVLATGALHVDGLMDACDGIFGGRTAVGRLEIMRDSRVGSYGVLAGALQLLLKYAALSALPLGWRGAALVMALSAGRWAMVGATWVFPYARPEGLGAAFKAGVTWPSMVWATLFALAVAWASLGAPGLALLALAGAAAWLTGAYAAGKLGGLTGDCYGAVNEVVETALLLALLAWRGSPTHA